MGTIEHCDLGVMVKEQSISEYSEPRPLNKTCVLINYTKEAFECN